jgi:hypothetical protein
MSYMVSHHAEADAGEWERRQWGGNPAAKDASKYNSPFTCRKKYADENIYGWCCTISLQTAFHLTGIVSFNLPSSLAPPPIFSVNFRGSSAHFYPTMLKITIRATNFTVSFFFQSRTEQLKVELFLVWKRMAVTIAIFWSRPMSWSDIQYSVFKVLRAKNICCMKQYPKKDLDSTLCIVWHFEVTKSFFPRLIDRCRQIRKALSYKPVDNLGWLWSDVNMLLVKSWV